MLGGEGSPDSPEGAHLAEAAAGCAPPTHVRPVP